MQQLKKYKETILYLIFGVLSTIVNIGTYALCTRSFDLNYLLANAIAWLVAVVFAYITNKFFVFQSNEIKIRFMIKEFTSFMSCRIVSGLVEMLLMFVMINLIMINDFVVKIVTNIVVVILNYIFSKLIIFKNDKITTGGSEY